MELSTDSKTNSNPLLSIGAPLKDGEISMGTTICAMVFKDGVILAADSRTTSGTTRLSKHYTDFEVL